ncbi:hypothetical protein GURASL_17540 [Geotalea uraniireducens]|uniref:Tetratricopeptide repeat protein n=1 Tax=Geotalea uraniireducens TaxID=351604 RepID=A0ABM8EJX5_9BACT|nr:hypothetical protein [Geotalea uraniireducens]BDV42831.1 hypothetical protein GURASL_17540 [Geotalea uraniireducens]
MPGSILFPAGSRKEETINGNGTKDLTPIKGIRYYYPPEDAVLVFKDEKARIPYGSLPIPLLEEDFTAIEGEPSYDAVGRGIYHALRNNPDCNYASRYAELLRDAFPHYIAELASHAIMLDNKDVEVPYLDRKINCLKILALLEPDNGGLALEIGITFLDKGLRLSALHLSTVSLYRAEHFLRRALTLLPGDKKVLRYLGEVCYLLGKYDEAANCWQPIASEPELPDAAKLTERLERISSGTLPRIPPVDYLEALGVAFNAFHAGDYEEALAIIQDVMMDRTFCDEFPIAEMHCVLGKSFAELNMPKYAEEALRTALAIDPDHEESRNCLEQLAG